jgi:hypothetical protein
MEATIAARFCGVDVEIRGASGKELRDWLWDYDAHPLAKQECESLSFLVRTGRVGLTSAKLFKTDNFLAAQPFGDVPAAFGPDAERPAQSPALISQIGECSRGPDVVRDKRRSINRCNRLMIPP